MATSTTRRVLGLLAAATCMTATVFAAAPGASAAGVAKPLSGPGVCPKDGLIPISSGLTNGVVKLGSSATVTGSTGRACGVLKTNKAGKLISFIKPANTKFAPVQTKVGLLSFPTTLKVVSPLTGPAGFGATGLSATLGGKVVATADIMGQKCDIPLTLKLTTGKSGALTGQDFAADAGGVQTGKLVDGTFAVPAIQPSATCNAVVATLSNTLLGLPLAAGASSITYDATIAFGML